MAESVNMQHQHSSDAVVYNGPEILGPFILETHSFRETVSKFVENINNGVNVQDAAAAAQEEFDARKHEKLNMERLAEIARTTRPNRFSRGGKKPKKKPKRKTKANKRRKRTRTRRR